MSKRRHHYNPQYYLRGFTESEKSPFLWRYDKLVNGEPVKMNVLNAGVKRDYYMYTRANGVQDKETVENVLNDLFEKPANPIIEKIRSGNFDLNQIEKNMLGNYLSITITRVPRNRQRVERIMPSVIDHQLSEFYDRLPQLRKDYDFTNEQEQQLIEYMQRWAQEPPDVLYLPTFSPKLAELIPLMNWYFIRPAKGKCFLSCDNPAAFTEANGFKPPSGQLLFPVSKNIVLWAIWEQIDRPTVFTADQELTQEINRSIAGVGVQYVYSCCREEWIKDLILDILSTIDAQTLDN